MNLNSSVGDTIIRGNENDIYHVEDIGIFKNHFKYYSLQSLNQYPVRKVMYVHNMGFFSEERIYNDSIVKWELESVRGIPISSFIEKSSFQYFAISEK